jgi:HEAT repeat protein
MSAVDETQAAAQMAGALGAPDSSTRLQAALAAGTRPQGEYVEVLVAQCAVEPDFFVRDMLTWALMRHDHAAVIARLRRELGSPTPQARAQALHTLSKIGDPDTWQLITRAHLLDEHDEVSRAAWRTAAGLVPAGQEVALAETLATQFARGDRDLRLSLSRAFVVLGSAVWEVVERVANETGESRSTHAIATQRLMEDPDEGFDAAISEARKVVALRDAPRGEGKAE